MFGQPVTYASLCRSAVYFFIFLPSFSRWKHFWWKRSAWDGAVHGCCTYLQGIHIFLKRVCVISHCVGRNRFHWKELRVRLLFFCLETWVLIVSGEKRMKSRGDPCRTFPHILLHREWQPGLQESPPEPGEPVHFVSAPLTLLHVAPSRLLSRRAQPRLSARPPRLISSLRSHGDLAAFLCADGRTLFCSSHGHPQEALWEGRTGAPALTFLNSLPPRHPRPTPKFVSWMTQDDSIYLPRPVMTYLKSGEFPPGFSTVICFLTSYPEWFSCWRV